MKFQLSVAEKEEEEETTTTAIIEQRNITENTTPNTASKSVSRRLIPLRHSRLLQFVKNILFPFYLLL